MNFVSKTLVCLSIVAATTGLSACNNTDEANSHQMKQSGNGEPVNYVVYDDNFSSAGMPDAAFVRTLANQGVKVVINIAPPESEGSLADEAALVEAANMEYLNIPVDWNAPTLDDVEHFLGFMLSNSDENVFLHCQMNMRATAFAMLHRVINQGVAPEAALKDMNQVWQPNQTWAKLMNDALADHGIDFEVPASKE